MTRDVEKQPIKVPSEFGTAAAALAKRSAAKLEMEYIPFMDLPYTCVAVLYEAPELTVAHIADTALHPEYDDPSDDPNADSGYWALLAPKAVDRLAHSVGDGKATVAFVREDTRFREALANEYWTPEDGDTDD